MFEKILEKVVKICLVFVSLLMGVMALGLFSLLNKLGGF